MLDYDPSYNQIMQKWLELSHTVPPPRDRPSTWCISGRCQAWCIQIRDNGSSGSMKSLFWEMSSDGTPLRVLTSKQELKEHFGVEQVGIASPHTPAAGPSSTSAAGRSSTSAAEPASTSLQDIRAALDAGLLTPAQAVGLYSGLR